MKNVLVVALKCLNAGLLVALIAGVGTEKAYGQVMGSNCLVVTGNIRADYDAVYVIDLGRRRLAAWRYDAEQDPPRLVCITPNGGRDLKRDFKRTGGR